ncbi:MAG: polysaccharide deacetylase family protein [Anaerolineae bacterium]
MLPRFDWAAMILQRLTRVPWRALPSWLTGNRLRILMYHSISDNPHDPHAVSPAVFRRQMHLLQNYRVVSFEQGLKLLPTAQVLRKSVIITFDDALQDFYTHALPVLKEFGYPVTVFIPTGLVGQCAVWDSYDQTKRLMAWSHLESCQRYNVSFGSHTVNHARLTTCTAASLEIELRDSLSTLRARLEQVIPALAYPGGYQDQRVRQAARQAGYLYGLGTASRWGNGPETDPFQLRRESFIR